MDWRESEHPRRPVGPGGGRFRDAAGGGDWAQKLSDAIEDASPRFLREGAFTVDCPRCGAKAGTRCHAPGGGPKSNGANLPHELRWQVWSRTQTEGAGQ